MLLLCTLLSSYRLPRLLHFRRSISSSAPPPSTSQPLDLPLSHPIYTIWASNTGLGKTLVSTGLAASTLLSPPPSSASAKFIYIKPVQTGYPSDSDSRFVFRKFSQIFLRRRPSFVVSASNHVLKASASAAETLLGFCSEAEGELRDLDAYEERRLVGEDWAAGTVSELICKTMYGWREAISPHLAAEREGGAVPDKDLLELLGRCLGIGTQHGSGKIDVWSVVETAGGVASPGPSGTLQCDLYRYALPPSIVLWLLN